MPSICTFAVLLGILEPSAEAPAPPVAAERRTIQRVNLGIVGDGWLDPVDLGRALEVGLQDLEVSVTVERWPADGTIFDQLRRARTITGTQSGTAALWLVPRSDDAGELYVLPPGSDLGYVRQLELPTDPTERSEAVTVVVRGMVQALEDGIPADLRAVEPPPADPPAPSKPVPVPPAPARPPPVRMAMGLHYLGQSLTSKAPWQSGPGVELAVHARPGVRIMVGAGVTFGRAKDDLLPLELVRLPLQFGAGYVHEFVHRIQLDATAQLDTERLAWSSASDADELAQLDGAYWRLGLGPTVGVGVRLVSGLFVRLAAGMQGWVIDRELAVEVDGTQVTVLDPHPVSASVTLGLRLEFPRGPALDPH